MVVNFMKKIFRGCTRFSSFLMPLIKYGVIALLGVIVILSLAPLFPIPGNFKSLVVMSGSMEPAIHVGSVVVIKPVGEVKVGDVVTFEHPSEPQNLITHRVKSVEDDMIKTKGDANNTPDNWEIKKETIQGKMFFSAPYLGYAVHFAKTPKGFLLLIILPAILIILDEIWTIKKEIEKRYQGKKERRYKTEVISVMVFALFSLAVSSVRSFSLFSDTELASGNTITVGTWESESLGEVVINEVYYDVKDDGSKGTEDKNEWIELYNNSDNPVNLKNWSLVDGAGTVKNINPNGSIPAKDFIVLSHDHSTWSLYWSLPSGVSSINLTGSGEWLNNGGDKLILKNDKGEEVDFVAWGSDVLGWNLNANDGKSIARKIKGVDTDSPDDWQVLDSPNPGTNPHPSEENQSVLIEESSATPTPSPTPTTEPTPTPSPTPETSPTPTPTAEPPTNEPPADEPAKEPQVEEPPQEEAPSEPTGEINE